MSFDESLYYDNKILATTDQPETQEKNKRRFNEEEFKDNSVFKQILNKETIIEKMAYTSIYQTPLMYACYIGNVNYVNQLLRQCGRLDANNNSALDYARDNGCEEIINKISQYEYNEAIS